MPLVEQHAAEVAALTMLRSHAVASPRHHRRDVEALEARIAAHLDGLREAGEAGWLVACDAVAANPEVGEATAVVALALSSPAGRARRLSGLSTVLERVPATLWVRAGAAVRWLDGPSAAALMEAGQHAGDHRHRLVALGAASACGQAPTGLIVQGLGDPRTAAVAAEAAGVLGDHHHHPALRSLLTSDDPATRFAAARALVLRDDEPAAWRVLLGFAEARSPFRHEALDLAARHAAPGSHVKWLHRLISDPTRSGDALVLAGAWGDPLASSWLVERMRDPLCARRAGAMFSLINGVDLDDEGLARTRPDDTQEGPRDDPQEAQAEPDPDHALAWPDPDAIARWSAAHPLPVGIRHLAGRPLDAGTCTAVLADGFQHQRQAAALELVRLTRGVLTTF